MAHRRLRVFDVVVAVSVVACCCWGSVRAVDLPTGISGQLAANLSVDRFFALWSKLTDDDLKISGKPYTIFAPQNRALNGSEQFLVPDVKKLMQGHIVAEKAPDLNNVTGSVSVSSLDGRTIEIRRAENGSITVNNSTVVQKNIKIPNGILVIVEGYLFPSLPLIKPTTEPSIAVERSSGKQTNVNPQPPTIPAFEGAAKNQSNTTFVENVMEVLSFLKGRVRVFQHFLSRSNVSRLLNEGEDYTVFVPTDHAFQRWHPIDWGFYPFSVPEFTESVIVNHFAKGSFKQDSIKDGQVIQTLGGREITFKRTPSLTANGAAVLKGEPPVKKGSIIFIGEVLFVSESVVSKLHQQHRDKETPPLLAFPWFGAQFLSHAFLALERDKRFVHITRFLNLADLAPHVSGAGYTFFVPTDTAFEELGLDKMPDNFLSNREGLEMLLNHFVKGRLYDKDLVNGTVLTTLGNQTLTITRTKDNVRVKEALIVESEVFVYNLGTMFYIDKVLYATIKVPTVPLGSHIKPTIPTTTTSKPTIVPDVEFTTSQGSESVTTELEHEILPEVLFGDGTPSPDSDSEHTTQASSKQNIVSPK